MTQALLNNLSSTIEEGFNSCEKISKDNIADFAKILNKKTSENQSSNTTVNTNDSVQATDDNAGNNNGMSQIVQKQEIIQDLKTIDFKNLSTDCEKETTQLEDTIEEALIEAEAIEAIGYILIQEEAEVADDSLIEDTDDEEIPTIQDDTITIEDPTMNNEELIYRQPLENPATAMMLKSQLQKHNFKDKNENSNSNDEESNNNTALKANEITSMLKSFDKVQQEEISSTASASVTEKNTAVPKETGTKLKDIVDEKMVEDLNIESVEAESAGAEGNSGSLMNNQSPQEQVVKMMINGVNKAGDRIEIQSNIQTSKAPTEATASKILEQISKQIEGLYNGSKVNIVLNPESLGKVSLQILNLKEGLSAQFTVTTQDAQNAIMKGLAGLKENLLAHGVNVDSVTVKLQETDNNEKPFDWTEQEGSRGGNKQQGNRHQNKDEKQFEQMMFEFSENGNV